MSELTKEEYRILKKHIEEIERIIKNASASSISAELRDVTISINKRMGYNDCSNCNSGLYRMMTRVYSMYIKKNTKTNGSKDKGYKTSGDPNREEGKTNR